MSPMRVDLNAKVRTRDGEDAGQVERAVIDPDTSEVAAFVVSTGGLLGKSVIVPRVDLERASRDGDVLVLGLSKDELDDLKPYVPTDFGVPPIGWSPLAPYNYPMPGYLWPAGYAYTPPPLPGPMVEPSDDTEAMTVDKGATVMDRDGEEVGVVDDVFFEPGSGQLSGVIVRLGGFLRTTLGGGETVEIRGRMIDHVSGGIVHLRTSKNELKRVA